MGLPTSVSASATSGTGPQRSGDIGNSTFSFGGINTGTSGSIPPWVYIAAVAVVGVIALAYVIHRK